MKKRINTIACALLLAALAAPVSHARAPIARDKVVTHAQSSVLAGLGQEGGGVRKHVAKKKSLVSVNVLAGLGNEGGALVAQWETVKLRPWAN